jgi:hypothetical protein
MEAPPAARQNAGRQYAVTRISASGVGVHCDWSPVGFEEVTTFPDGVLPPLPAIMQNVEELHEMSLRKRESPSRATDWTFHGPVAGLVDDTTSRPSWAAHSPVVHDIL